MDDFANLEIFDSFKVKNSQDVKTELEDNIIKKQKQQNQNLIEINVKQEQENKNMIEEEVDQQNNKNDLINKRAYNVEEMKVRVETTECVHEIVIPCGLQEDKERLKWGEFNSAKEYKFELDGFQKKAIECLERNESVLVAAHTSAGKTVVAEYAIAMAFRQNQRVIYTSPIKALSNQKYRELNSEFKDVGLITGDVTINQNSSCLVMTTEILRNMLYRGSQITREVQWVIFDEVHYMRDKERGVVWEETIILLNPNVRYVFLSATIPNAREFAMWIAGIKNQITNVVYTDYRPTPLQHYLFPSAADGIYMVVDEQSKFREDNFQKALAQLSEPIEHDLNKKHKKPTEGSDLFKILKMVFEKKFNPVIIFSFSKREVEALALSLKQFDLTSEEEKKTIEQIFNDAMEVLAEEDKELPQIQMMMPILKRGIGIHHGGLLPIVKEVTEILFQEGLLKALFSTETFSMGLNMPAKTVIFTAVRKFDGESFRWISGGEYIQMSGRAGRRGIDDRGITILMIDQKMEPEIAKAMLKGVSDPLNSSFHLSYNMLLNSFRIEDIDIEFIVKRSFLQFQNDFALPQMNSQLLIIQQQNANIIIQNESLLGQIYEMDQQIESFKEVQKSIMIQAKYILKYMNLGRVIRIKKDNVDWGWGVVINLNQKKMNNNKYKMQNTVFEECIIIDVMIQIKKRNNINDIVEPELDMENEESSMEVVAMLLSNIFEISSVRLTLPKDLTKVENKQLVKATMARMLQQFNNDPPILDPITILNDDIHLLQDSHLKITNLKSIRNQLIRQLNSNEDFKQQMTIIRQKKTLEKQEKHLINQIEDAQKMVLLDDNKCMKRVLRRLNYINKEDIIQIKGKVACEISSCDEILVTECMFSGLFNDMEPNLLAALLSCLIHDENSQQEKLVIKTQGLQQKYESLLDNAKKVHQVFLDSKISIDETEYLNSFKPQMMDITFNWCNGASFKEICGQTDIFEGSIIRCLRRLDELLSELSNAAKSIGNVDLQAKFQQSSLNLKRGIVFAASLYL